jgi:hypothetical protein
MSSPVLSTIVVMLAPEGMFGDVITAKYTERAGERLRWSKPLGVVQVYLIPIYES